MSVLIKGMEMPDKCTNCPCSYNMYWCLAVARFEDTELRSSSNAAFQRPDWCPLVEVQVPHSLLVDVDKQYAQTGEPSEAVQEATRVINAWLSENDSHDIKIAEAYTKEGLRRKIVLIYPLRDKFYRPEDGGGD